MATDSFSIVGSGVSITTSGTSQSVSIPTDSSGNPARYVMISVTASAFVRPDGAGATATNTDMICNANEKTFLCVAGCSKIAALQQASSGLVTIVPITPA